MLRKIFNTAARVGKDIYYGLTLQDLGMETGRRVKTGIYCGVGAALNVAGVLTANPLAIVTGSAMLASSALSYWDAGARIRKYEPKP